MAGDKFLYNNAGVVTEKVSSQTSAGAGDAGKIPALNASGILDDTIINATVSSSAGKIVKLDGSGKLDSTVLPTGVGADTKSIVASESLSAGDFVNVYNATGTIKVRKADCSASSAGKRCHGFVIAAVNQDANATVYFEGTNNQRSSLTLGATYFLSTTGGISATAPSTSNYCVQEIGVAVSDTEISFEPQQPIILA